MKKLWVTFLKDAKLSFNGLYFYIEIGLAAVFVLVMLFVVPENFDQTQALAVYADSPYKEMTQAFEAEGADVVYADSLEALKKLVDEDRSRMGIAVYNDGTQLVFEYVLQGYEGDRLKALLKDGYNVPDVGIQTTPVETQTLAPDAERLSDRNTILPIYFTINVALMGLFIIASYIFLDKDEGVIKAYAVAPVAIWQYLASKVMIMSVVGIVTSLFVTVALVGFEVNYLYLIGLVFAFNLFGSTLGLVLASFFDTMAKAMGAMYAGIMILMLPSIAYMMPAFTPAVIKWFPSYPMLFAFRELLLQNGDRSYMLTQMGLFIALAVALFALANWRFKKTLTV